MWRLGHIRLGEGTVTIAAELTLSVREGRRTDATTNLARQQRHHPHLLDPTFSLSDSFLEFFVLPAYTSRGPKKDLLSSPGYMDLISPIPLCTCTLIDRCIVPHTKAKEASLSYHNTISMQNRSSVAKTVPPRSPAIIRIISWRRSLHPTPPTMSTSLLPI